MMKRIFLFFLFLLLALSSTFSSAQTPALTGVFSSTSSQTEPEAIAYFNKGTALGYTLPNTASQGKINTFIRSLKSDGSYSEIDVMWLFRNNGDHDFASLNVIDPNNFECTETGSPTYTQDLGFTGNGSSTFLNTQWVASTHAVKYTLNSASAFFYVYANGAENTRIWGAAGAANTNRIECIVQGTGNPGQMSPILNSNTVTAFTQINDAEGFYQLVKTSTTNIDIYRNGILIGSTSIANTNLPDVSMYVLARNAAGTASGFTTSRIGCLGFGSKNINPTTLYNAWVDYSGLSITGRNRISTSPDGINWTRQTAIDNAWKDVAYSPSLNIFVAVAEQANGTNNRVVTSTDGVTWTVRSAGGNNQWISVAWSPGLNLFCAVALSGSNRVMTSPDGITWTPRTTIDTEQWVHIAWSPGLNLFCAVSETSGTNNIMTSPDGITWTGRTAPSTIALRGITWSAELSIFCASSFTGPMLTSSDGVTWIQRTSAANNQWCAVAWSSTLNLFAAVANTGSQRVQTSPDGINWTIRNAANNAGAYRGLTWSPRLNLFVACADNLNAGNGSIMYSSNGTSWSVANGADNDFNGIIDGATLMVAVAIGEN